MGDKFSKETNAYTSGLKVKQLTNITKERKLPMLGKVFVKVGDIVDYDTVIAETTVPGNADIITSALHLGISPEVLQHYMLKKEGDPVNKEEIIASYRALFGLINKFSKSPFEGKIESISSVTGRVVIRELPTIVRVKAYIKGIVKNVLPNEGAIISANGAFIQGIFGIGGETHGTVKILTDSQNEPLRPESITKDNKGQVLVGSSYVSIEAIKKAIEVGAVGIIVASIGHRDLEAFIGKVIGVAITGQENLGLTLILTEGFGEMAMSKRTFTILKNLEGHMASINGATQIRAGVIRPEIIIIHENELRFSSKEDELISGMVPGTLVRIIREPYFGAIGRVKRLPVQLQQIESESKVRAMIIELEDGEEIMIPRANAEIIEE